MLMLKWIFIILNLVQSVFSCEPSKPSDPCCPDEDECCDEDVWGVCCRENRNMYIAKFKPTFHQEWVHVCLCTTSIPSIHTRSGMCSPGVKNFFFSNKYLLQFWSHLWEPSGAAGENGSTVLQVDMWWAWRWRLRAIRDITGRGIIPLMTPVSMPSDWRALVVRS